MQTADGRKRMPFLRFRTRVGQAADCYFIGSAMSVASRLETEFLQQHKGRSTSMTPTKSLCFTCSVSSLPASNQQQGCCCENPGQVLSHRHLFARSLDDRIVCQTCSKWRLKLRRRLKILKQTMFNVETRAWFPHSHVVRA